jgi:hypothetical protein
MPLFRRQERHSSAPGANGLKTEAIMQLAFVRARSDSLPMTVREAIAIFE